MLHIFITVVSHGPLVRYVKLRVAHALGMPGTLTPPPRFSDPDMHHGTCVTHVPWCMPGSLTSGFFWSRWRGKRSRHSRRMRNPRFCVSGKRSIGAMTSVITGHPTVGPTTCSVWQQRKHQSWDNPVTYEFTSQRAGNADSFSMSWLCSQGKSSYCFTLAVQTGFHVAPMSITT